MTCKCGEAMHRTSDPVGDSQHYVCAKCDRHAMVLHPGEEPVWLYGCLHGLLTEETE